MRHVAVAVAVAVAVGCGSWFGPTATSRVCDSSMPMLSASDTEATAMVHPASCSPACVGAAALPWSRTRRVCRSTMARSVGVGASRTSNPKPGVSVNVVDVVTPQETLRGSGHSLALCRCEAGVGHGAGWGGRGGSGRVRYSSQGAGATLAAQPGGLDDVVRVEAGAARRREAARLELGDVAPPGPRARARRLRRNVYPAAFRVWVGVDTARRPGSALAQWQQRPPRPWPAAAERAEEPWFSRFGRRLNKRGAPLSCRGLLTMLGSVVRAHRFCKVAIGRVPQHSAASAARRMHRK